MDPRAHVPAIRVAMLPRDTNAYGTIFGGHILSLIDQAGAVGAHRHGARRVVTVAMDKVEFKQPVQVGDIVSCYTELLRLGRTSVSVRVRVVAHRPEDLERSVEVTQADVTYVNIDETGRPIALRSGAVKV